MKSMITHGDMNRVTVTIKIQFIVKNIWAKEQIKNATHCLSLLSMRSCRKQSGSVAQPCSSTSKKCENKPTDKK